jgi:quercetin dioxygenase-like cupin family protein
MNGGWFVGDFEPCIFQTKNAEVAVKYFKAGEKNPKHYHNHSTEVTMIVSGTCLMSGTKLTDGDIVVVHPEEVSDFEAITDCILVVYKSASVSDDKHLA